MHDPWAWTTAWGLAVGERGGMGGGEQRRKNSDNCSSLNNEIFK